MPLYLFQNPETQEIKEVFLTMREEPEKYRRHIDDSGVEWKRVYSNPQASIDPMDSIDPYSQKDFITKLANKNDTLGALWDRSAELSAKRAEKDGTDPVKQKFYDKYAKDRSGTRHPNELREIAARKAKEAGIEVKWSK